MINSIDFIHVGYHIDPFIMHRFFINHKTLDKKTQVLLKSQFIDTNKSIERMFNLNLKKLGYPVS